MPSAEESTEAPPALELRDVAVHSTRRDLPRPVVTDVSFAIAVGEILGLVGESGCGKSTLCRAIAGLLPDGMELAEGTIALAGADVTGLSPRAVQRSAPRTLSMVFQDPLAALNPVMPIGDQVAEAFMSRGRLGRRDALSAAAEQLGRMGFPDPTARLGAYPSQLSGGQRQRVVLAMALATDPVLLLADEPTSALDVSTQAQILTLLREEARRRGVAVLLVSHDYGVIAEACERVCVMYGGRIVESGPTGSVLGAPAHPYTQRLIASLPSLSRRHTRLPVIPGRPPTLEEELPGCPFYPRCDIGEAGFCDVTDTPLVPLTGGRGTACLKTLAGANDAPGGRGPDTDELPAARPYPGRNREDDQ
ncbi:MAG TPA: ABC transporter ATP-binding protein [Solirubrobacteraceae bacterium]|nr:ABC transporter ATP-binding protein [Solirubrobacteraceae bacterium]